jgi:hypothetical protein
VGRYRIKNPHAVALGKLGASKGGKARAAKLPQARIEEIASLGGKARWARWRAKKAKKDAQEGRDATADGGGGPAP